MYDHPAGPYERCYSQWCEFPEMKSSPDTLQDELKKYGLCSSTGVDAAGIRYDDIVDIHKIDDHHYAATLQYQYFILNGKMLSGCIRTKLNMRSAIVDQLYKDPIFWYNTDRDLKKLISQSSWYLHGCISLNDDETYTLDVQLITDSFWPTASDDNGGIAAMYEDLYI